MEVVPEPSGWVRGRAWWEEVRRVKGGREREGRSTEGRRPRAVKETRTEAIVDRLQDRMAEETISRLNALDRNQHNHLDLKQSIKIHFLLSYCIEMTRSPTRGRKQKLIYTSGVNFRTGSNLSSREVGGDACVSR